MTLRLVLIRHAKAGWSDDGGRDHARPLAERGLTDAPRIAAWLADQGFAPDQVLCSDAVRTRQTLDLMLPRWSDAPEVAHLPQLYNAAPAQLLVSARAAQGRTVALIAHNPGIGALAAQLAAVAPSHPRFGTYPTTATTVLEFDTDSWREIGNGLGKLRGFVVPADL